MTRNINDTINDSIAMYSCTTAEVGAIAAAAWIGRGDSKAADKAAVEAIRQHLNSLPISGTVVIGEGERDKAPMLYIGETVGSGGPHTDIALDPLEGTDICARGTANALAVVGMSEAGGRFLHAPDVYMEKIAAGLALPPGTIDLDKPVADNIADYAAVAQKPVDSVTIAVLDRPRHYELIADIRAAGARVNLIGDGDIYAVIATTMAESTVDMYMGSGGAPEGVLAAAALRCLGGTMQGRLVLHGAEKIARAQSMGITDPAYKYATEDLAFGNVVFAACGVTAGELLDGVRYSACGGYVMSESLLLRSRDKSMRRIRTRIPLVKF